MLIPLSTEVKLPATNFSSSLLLQERRCSCLFFGSSPNSRYNCRKGFKTSASKKSVRKRRKDITSLPPTETINSADLEEAPGNPEPSIGTSEGKLEAASRGTVLQACIITSAGLLLFGVLIRQVSHLAYVNELPIHDATEVKFGFETWHIGLILALVVLISSSRYILLKSWPDFAESSEAANQQILGSLKPFDIPVVAFLPGISEELLFRGGLMPAFGLDWRSALAIGAIFGILHLSGGRKTSYAIWATLVGFAYGLATVASSNLIVPMITNATRDSSTSHRQAGSAICYSSSTPPYSYCCILSKVVIDNSRTKQCGS